MTPVSPKIRTLSTVHGMCVELSNTSGSALISLQGGQLLSWTPVGQQDVFWTSPQPAPKPAPLRGGVPICWPWFARQGVEASSPQHGVVRTLPWYLLEKSIDADTIEIVLAPDWQSGASTDAHEEVVKNLGVPLVELDLTQTIRLDHSLTQTLKTHNCSQKTIRITQALHSYFRVGDARQVQIEGLLNKTYLDKLQGFAPRQQSSPFVFDSACDRIYTQTDGHFSLVDPYLRRTIRLESTHSQSLVVWNPGVGEATKMADIGADAWSNFFCLEVANAEPDGVTLAPGARCEVTQKIWLE